MRDRHDKTSQEHSYKAAVAHNEYRDYGMNGERERRDSEKEFDLRAVDMAKLTEVRRVFRRNPPESGG